MRMLFFGLGIAVVVVAGFFVITVFAPRVHDEPIRIGTEDASLETPGATTTRAQFRSGSRQPVPPGFKGPTGQPHINGPTSNPPNY